MRQYILPVIDKMAACLFGCGKTAEGLTKVGQVRINSIIAASKERLDTIHIQLEDLLQANPDAQVDCHIYLQRTHKKET